MSKPIAIGDRLFRKYAIDSAIVEGVSDCGWWVVTPGGEHYHVSRFSIEVGDWKRVG